MTYRDSIATRIATSLRQVRAMKIQWEYNLVEKPFCEQLKTMGWEWIEGDPDLRESTERTSSREVLQKGLLASALRRLKVRDGKPWLDDARIALACRPTRCRDLHP